MRKLLIVALLLAGLFGLHLSAQAGEEGEIELKKDGPHAVAVAPPRAGPSPAAIAELILDGGQEQQIFAAQYLAQADHATLLAIQHALRTRNRPVGSEIEATTDGQPDVPIITIESRILEVSRGFLADIGVDARGGFEMEGAPEGVSFIDDTQLEVILRATQKSEHAKLVTAPRISVYDGQRATVSVLNQQSYVSDFTVVQTERGKIADPLVQVVQEGVMLDMKPTLSANRRFVNLDFHGVFAQLTRPIAERRINIEGQEMRIQRPWVALGLALAEINVPVGGTLLIWPEGGASATPHGQGARVVLVRISDKLFSAPPPGASETDLTPKDGTRKKQDR